MKFFLNILFIVIITFIQFEGSAQKTIVKGLITDELTKETIPFVNISFLNTSIGTITDTNGNFHLETDLLVDSLLISYIGYESQKIKIENRTITELDINLKLVDMALDEITIFAGENPALRIIRNIQKNKKKNNSEKLEYFQCNVYNKLQLDLSNINDKFQKRKAFNKFQFVFDLKDSSEVLGKTFLPVFISENYSQYYYQKRPERKKEIIIANKISGIENKSYSEFTGQMYIDINMYNNYIDVFGKQFVSPFSNNGLMVYKYFLEDSSFINNKWCYNITYKPKRKQERTFYGNFWVNDSTWAIVKVNARISKDANINYVKDLILEHEFDLFFDSVWFKTKDKLLVDINLLNKTQGLFGRKLTIYKNLKLNRQDSANLFSSNQLNEAIVIDTIPDDDISYWNSVRPEKLSEKEEQIYQMVDSVKNVPIFRTFTDIIYLLAYGYYTHKKIEYGPYFKTFSFNPIEGSRFRIGGRTSNAFSTNLMLYGHVAYGTKDKRFKYGLGTLYMINKNPRFTIDLYYENDLSLLGQSVNAFSEDNILASILAIRPNDNLLNLERYRVLLEKEWFTGFSNTLRLFYGTLLPSEKIPFQNSTNNESWNNLVASEVSFKTRFAFNEKVLSGEFERVSLGTKFPIIDIDLTIGLKDVLNSDFEYYRASFKITQAIDVGLLGYFKYAIGIGKIWGELPFPLLYLHEGNETYALDDYAYNLLSYYELGSDFYQSIYLEHKFQGLLFNKIPLFRKLKWRETVQMKVLNGSITEKNKQVWDFPQSLSEIDKPYVEVGVGIENIFKLIRIDAMWRLTNREKDNIQKFGIKAKLQFIF